MKRAAPETLGSTWASAATRSDRSGLLGDAELLSGTWPARDGLVVTNETVGAALRGSARGPRCPASASSVVLPDGEQYKTLEVLGRVFDALVAARLNRDACVVALGGGVVGDMAGFAAACYQRGVDFVQVPTTLLAQVDSSVGGKTGVNHPGGKNLIGAFHQPRAVITDTRYPATLPPRELRAGLAEVIKYGLVDDADFLGWIEEHVEALLALDRRPSATRSAVPARSRPGSSLQTSASTGGRALLNLGHTFGHAIETATGYGEWLHGEAVATGMLMAAELSQRLRLDGRDRRRTRPSLAAAGAADAAPPHRRRTRARTDGHGQEGAGGPSPPRTAVKARAAGGQRRLPGRRAQETSDRTSEWPREPAGRSTPAATTTGLAPYAQHEPRLRAAVASRNRRRATARSTSVTATGSSIRRRSAAWSTRPRSSSTTKATSTVA